MTGGEVQIDEQSRAAVAPLPRLRRGRVTEWAAARAGTPALVDVLAITALALLMRLVFRHAELDTDPTYALFWGREVIHGHLPDFAFVSAPTAHPLPTLEAVLVAPLGISGAANAMLFVSYVCLGGILWGTFRVAEAVFSRAVATLAMLLLAISFAIVDVGLGGFLDVQFVAIVLWAAVLELRRPRRGAAVLLALAVAGLLRPEAWLLCGLYWLYAFGARPSRTSLRSIGGAAIVLSAPVAWLVMDSIVTGHPLFAFTNARQSGESVALGGFGNSELLSFALSLLRNAVRTPVLIGGGLGVALALAVRRRASTLPAAILILLLAVFAGFVVLELPVPNRMLLTPATLFAIFCAFAALGWLDHRPAGQRRLWAGAGAAVIVLLVATTPAEITRLEHLDQRRAALERIVSDLRGLDQLPAARAALRSCALLTVGAPEIVPYTAYYLDRPLQRLALATWPGTTTRGAYLALNSYQASAFVRGGLKPEQGISVPAGYRRVAADRSWQLLVRGC